jgi:putative transposase
MKSINKSRHARYLLNLHIVWIPKYRTPILAPYHDELCDILKGIAAEKGYEVLALEVMPDHVHLFVSVPPTVAPCEVVKTFKGQSGRKLLMAHPDLADKTYRSSLWSHSYFVSSAGDVSSEIIEKYIQGQYE